MPADTVIVRRLKSLRQQEAEAAAAARARKAALEAEQQEADSHGMTVSLLRCVRRKPIPIPLDVAYGPGSAPGRDEAFWARRAQFYAHCAIVFGFEDWSLYRASRSADLGDPGRDGRRVQVRPIDQESSVNVNIASAPIEYLVARGWMETKKDRPGVGLVRFSTAIKLRELAQAAAISGLKGQNYLGGSGGGFIRSISDHKLDCMLKLGNIMAAMTSISRSVVEAVVLRDEWVWEKRKGWKKRKALIERLHRGLDYAAVMLGLLDVGEFKNRWRRKRKTAKRSAAQRPEAARDRQSPGPSPASTPAGRRARQP